MTLCRFFLLFVLATSAPSALWASAQTMYEDALVKENGERDLESALVLYRQVSTDASAFPWLKHQASYRAAVCLERLGRLSDALSAYRNLLDQNPTPSLVSDTETAVRRVENQIDADQDAQARAAENARLPNGSPDARSPGSSYRHWTLSAETAYVVLDEAPDPFKDLSKGVVWASLGYKTAPWAELGLEGGQLFPKVIHTHTDHSTFPEKGSVRVTTTYVGPYFQVSKPIRSLPITCLARIGVGASRQNIRLKNVTQNLLTNEVLVDDISQSRTDGTIVTGAGVDWTISPLVSVGVGGRLLLIVQNFSSVNTSDTDFHQREAYRLRYVGMPYLRVSIHF